MNHVAVAPTLPSDPGIEHLRTFAGFRDLHRGENFLVCGCGESLNLLEDARGAVTIGVNDVGRRFTPDYLVVVNPRAQFSAERFRHVEGSGAKALFTQITDLAVKHPHLVRFRLGAYGGTDFRDPEVLHYTQNSPYVAACLAVHMGARRIGLLGVDFTDRHFFGSTGSHPLTGRVPQIDHEYARLAQACRARGIELFNLSPESRLRSLPKTSLEIFLGPQAHRKPSCSVPAPAARVFVVNYRSVSWGDLFQRGLRHAAAEAGLPYCDAEWDAPGLASKIRDHDPDLLFVVHGRKFGQRWGRSFDRWRSAVWLVDEPYEVDDSSLYSAGFDRVFVNDPSTLHRHRNARYLPGCYDPRTHFPADGPRRYRVGFVGGTSPTRERMFLALARKGLLDYLVGGPWRSPILSRLTISPLVSPEEAAALYRQTRIVLNVFRDRHHFNRERVGATSLNFRVYEALACGALVVSERRREVDTLVPQLPTFGSEEELVAIVERFLSDQAMADAVRDVCAARLRGGTYLERLRTVMSATSDDDEPIASSSEPDPTEAHSVASEDPWQECGPVTRRNAGGTLTLARSGGAGPGSERGIVSAVPYDTGVTLAFEVWIPRSACFVAKINQIGRDDQTTNSYHLYCDDRGAYLARHHHVFARVEVARDAWESLTLTHAGGALSFYRAGRLLHRFRDEELSRGYAFLGVKKGEVRLRNVLLTGAAAELPSTPPETKERVPAAAIHAQEPIATPRVSIVTTVYDRVECLRRCVRSVRGMTWHDYEHIIVSDAPPSSVVEEIGSFVREVDDRRIRYFNLERRFNNWGIAPAAAGLARARGELVSFLSDDNGYLPDHLPPLIAALDKDPGLGFAYSSCLYGGRLVLRHPVPAPGRIDLGQPLFRRSLFERHLGGTLPFQAMAWDWFLVEALLRAGIRFKHVDRSTFVFRLASYPRLVAALR